MYYQKPRKRPVSEEQLYVLVEYMENHPELARGSFRSIEARNISARLWLQATKKLNEVGIKRTPKEWQKHYTDYKCRLMQKAAKVTNGYADVTPLTPLEQRLVNVIRKNQSQRRKRSNSDEPLQSLLDESTGQFEVEQDDDAMDTKPNIDARSLSPASDRVWADDAGEADAPAPPRKRDASSNSAAMEERATRAIERQATSMERMAAALERLAEAIAGAADRFVNNNNGQFV